ncbi:Hypothetical protein CINCED_3A017464 [Cinara cedri]|uniref:Uncharacterized protein n=1 Tax=Cinara cedri TaxID=506608 RepID=A0A5E4NEL6_9HEMI|nr:Hypothetical protein CINCED_3A017464 [Cinara cedri]
MYSTVLCKKFVSTSIIQELSRSLNVVMIGVLSKNTIRLGCVKLFSHNTSVQLNKPSFLQTKSKTSIIFNSDRYYCKNYSPFPNVPEFPPVIWPNMFKSIKALLFSYLIIKPQYDNEFSLQDFAKHSKKAVEVVSNYIAKRDFSSLEGLVTGDVLEQVKSIVSKLNDEEIKDLGFNNDDIYLFLPVQLDIINDIKCNERQAFC